MRGLCRKRVWIFKISCINNHWHSSNFNFTFRSCWIWCHNLSGHYLGTDPRQFDQFDLSHMNDRIKIRDQQSWPQLWIQWLRQHLQKSDIFCTIGRQIWSPFKWTLGSSRDCIHLFLLVFESEGNHVHEVRYPHFPSCVTSLWVLSQISRIKFGIFEQILDTESIKQNLVVGDLWNVEACSTIFATIFISDHLRLRRRTYSWTPTIIHTKSCILHRSSWIHTIHRDRHL